MAVDPAEELGVVRWRGTVGDAVGPVLGKAVLLREALETRVGDGELHHHVRLGGLLVVAPEGRQWLLYAAFTWKDGK